MRLRDAAPSIAQEMRYATTYNFVGERIDGYLAAECILTGPPPARWRPSRVTFGPTGSASRSTTATGPRRP